MTDMINPDTERFITAEFDRLERVLATAQLAGDVAVVRESLENESLLAEDPKGYFDRSREDVVDSVPFGD
jgi:hypothetical protein